MPKRLKETFRVDTAGMEAYQKQVNHGEGWGKQSNRGDLYEGLGKGSQDEQTLPKFS